VHPYIDIPVYMNLKYLRKRVISSCDPDLVSDRQSLSKGPFTPRTIAIKITIKI